ncbi:lipopolysaccharide biosynthesis protein [Erythrobacter sp. MTPC3]|uniref:lipopolysaccharide biosynthesis protein n=1 Tax=Erythrobacter sp. MTPC3 TaxID=3056564 RepID=UPI0036F2C529
MRVWLQDDVLRRVLRNTGQMGAGKIAGAILHLASIAVTARVLDLTDFGLLMLFRSVAQMVAAIAKFQSWQALVHFGADPYERDDFGSLRSLWLRLALIDLVVGIAAMALGGAFVLSAASTVSIPTDFAYLAAAYCLIVPLQVSGTPTGILRLTDRFDLMAWQSLVTPGVRLIGVCIAFLVGAPLWAVVVAWVASDILGDLFLWVCAIAVGKSKGLAKKVAASSDRTVPRAILWRYLLGTNFNASLQQGALPLMTLAIGGIMGPSAAGAYRLAQTLLDALLTPAELAMRSLFPEISKLKNAKGERLKEIMRNVGLTSLWVSIPAGAILFGGSGIIVSVLAGEQYAVAGSLLAVIAWSLPALFLGAICETFMLGSGRALSPVLSRATIVGLSIMAILFLGEHMSLSDLGVALLVASYAGLLVLAVPTVMAMRQTQEAGPSE